MELEQEKSSLKISHTQQEHQHRMELESLRNDIKLLSKAIEDKEQSISSLIKNNEAQRKELETSAEEKEELERKLRIKQRKMNPYQNQSILESF